MPRIYVEFAGLDRIGTQCKSVSSKVDSVQSDLKRTIRQLDWDVRYESNIDNTATQIAQRLEQYATALKAYQRFIEDAHDKYVKLDEFKELDLSALTAASATKANSIITIAKSHIIPSLLNSVLPGSGLLYITSGIFAGNTPSFLDYSRTPSSSASADWLGYELSSGNPGITAWLGKASAEAQNEWGYAGVNAYLGKAEAEAKADASFMKTTAKKEYIDGKWVEKTQTEFLSAEIGAGASVSVLAADAEAGVGSDMLGLEGKAKGTVGTAKAEAKGEFNIGEDGIDANLKGEAMVSAVEGEASGTINFLGLEITGKIGGYAGALGVEGKAGIEDNKFVLEGGVAALLGVSGGIEIGFNDEGWDNFVDFVTFWD